MTQLLKNHCNHLIVSLFSLFLCLNVNGQNNPPVAVDDYYYVLTDSIITGNVLLNDYDPDPITVMPIVNTTPVVLSSNSTLVINPDGTFTSVFNSGFTGLDTFAYEICDIGTPVFCDTAFAYFNVASSFIQSVSATDVTNCGSVDGTITITPTITNSNWEYSIDSGLTWQSSPTFNNLPEGNYYVVLRDLTSSFLEYYANNSVVISAPVQPMINAITSTDPSNCGISDGGITVTATGSSLIYSIDGGLNWQASGTFTGLNSGTYPICVMNSNGTCNTGCGAYIATLTAPNTPSIDSTSMTNPTDCGLVDGTIGFFVSGGAGSYEYSLDGGMTWQANNLFTGLSGGTYLVCARNSNGTCQTCIAGGMTLTSPQAPVISNVSVSAASSCALSDGSIIISATGQTGIEYSIDGGTTWQANNTFTGLGYGYYDVFVRNNDGSCLVASSNNSIWLNAPNVPIISSVNSTNTTNCSVNNGSITVTATGQTGLQYSIDGGNNFQSSNAFTGLAGGTYNIVVRNNNGSCQVNYTNNPLILTAPNQPTITSVSSTNPTDCGVNDGTITVVGVGQMTLEYSIDGGVTFQSNNTFTGLAGGVYEVVLRNIDGTCINYDNNNPLTLMSPITPVITNTTSIDPTSCGVNDGTITVTAVSQIGIEYSIDGGLNWQSSNTFTGLACGTYNIAVRNGNGTCLVLGTQVVLAGGANQKPIAVDDAFSGTVNQPINGDLSTNDSDPDGNNLLYNPQLVTGPLSGLVSMNSNGTFIYTPNAGFGGSDMFTYSVCDNGTPSLCDSATVFISYNGNPPLVINNIAVANSTCAQNNGSIDIAASSANSLQYSIDSGQTWHTGSLFAGLMAGSYNVLVSDGTDTTAYANNPVTIIAITAPVITNVSSTNPTDCGLNNGSITVTATGQTGLQYSIDGGNNFQSSNVFTGLATGTYNVAIRNTNGTCLVSYTNNPVVLTTPIAPVITSVSSTNPTDCGLNDGSITIIATGQTGIEYSIDGGVNFQASNVFTGLAGGVYEVVIRNTNGTCIVYDANNPVTLIAPIAPVITNTTFANLTNCAANNGSVTINAVGNGTLEYSIDYGTTWQSSNIFTGLGCGNYPTSVRYTNGTCMINGNDVTLSSDSLYILQVFSVDASCNQANGGLSINVIGGTGNYEYSITGNTWQTNDSFPNIASGTYTIYARDGIDTVTYSSSVTINNISNPPTFVSTTMYSDSLFIDATSSGQGIQYSIDCGITWQASDVFFPAPMGNVCIGIQNADGSCPVFTNVTITNTAPVAVTDSISLAQNGYVSFNVLNNDFDNENNLFTATPQVQYYGIDSMTLTSAGIMTIPTNALNLGAYMINYQICEVYNPTNCSQGSVYFSINPSVDTFRSTMAIGATQTICIPTTDLPGTPVSTVIGCGTPTNIIIDSIVGACIYAYGDDYGSDTTCVVVCDNFGFCDSTIFIITVEDGVWPGDTDDDTYANNFDLLNIGLGFGLTGTARTPATNTWNGYITPNWGQSTPVTNIDYRHTDCNGDGIINKADTLAILQNYGASYQRKGAGGVLGTAPLYLLNDTSHYTAPHVSLPIILGEASNQAIDLYGGAFSIGYDTTIIEPNSVRITFDTSWVGNQNLDMISLQKNFGNDQQIEAAFTRIDGLNTTGHGILAKLDFTIKDDILRRGPDMDSVILTLDIFNVKFISNNENTVDVNPNSTNIVFTSVEKNPILDQYVSVFPNPARDQVHIAVENIETNQITVLDMNGRIIHHNTNNTQNNITLDVATYPSGVYMLQIHTSKGIVTKRLTVVK